MLFHAHAGAQETPSPLWQKIEDARAYMSSDRFKESRILFKQALDLAVAEKDRTAEAICAGNLGTLYSMTDNVEEALNYYKKGYEIAEEQNNKVLLAKFTGCIVPIFVQIGNAKEARKWLETEGALHLEDDPRNQFIFLYNKACVLLLENDKVSSLYYFDKARRYAEEMDLGGETVGSALMAWGDILYKSKRYKEAIEIYLEGMKQIKKGGNLAQEIFANRTLYVAYKQIGDTVNAAIYRERYHQINDSSFDHNVAESAGKRLADFERRQNDTPGGDFFNYFFLICIVTILLAVTVFAAVMMHRQNRRHKVLIDSQEEMLTASAGDEKETAADSMPDATSENTDRHGVSRETGTVTDEHGKSPGRADLQLRMTAGQQKVLLEKINLVMKNVSMICREDFNLATLSKAVGSNTKYVSIVINDTYGKSFKTYLNEFRIREACRRLLDNENFANFTIRAIHQELGFRTATSFVSAFRKVTGMTPSEYKKMHTADAVDDAPSPSGDGTDADTGPATSCGGEEQAERDAL